MHKAGSSFVPMFCADVAFAGHVGVLPGNPLHSDSLLFLHPGGQGHWCSSGALGSYNSCLWCGSQGQVSNCIVLVLCQLSLPFCFGLLGQVPGLPCRLGHHITSLPGGSLGWSCSMPSITGHMGGLFRLYAAAHFVCVCAPCLVQGRCIGPGSCILVAGVPQWRWVHQFHCRWRCFL